MPGKTDAQPRRRRGEARARAGAECKQTGKPHLAIDLDQIDERTPATVRWRDHRGSGRRVTTGASVSV
jgi:hypothetical protein